MLHGALDAILDASSAASGYTTAVKAGKNAAALACYGFLQALYVQQDAVAVLSKVASIDWRPSSVPQLNKIRDTRNRLIGHPAWAKEGGRKSSGIISHTEISSDRFRGHVYHESGAEIIDVDVSTYFDDNLQLLGPPMRCIEGKFRENERNFRRREAMEPLAKSFDEKFEYLLQRLHCNLSDWGRIAQAQAHAPMIRQTILSIETELARRSFDTEQSTLYFGRVLQGLEMLESMYRETGGDKSAQPRIDVIYDGFSVNLTRLDELLASIDSRLAGEP